MKRLLLLSIVLLVTHMAQASDQVRNLQSNLKNEGFYFGEVDGTPSAELNAAIRRYQIRNGLTVTGEADEETQNALGLASSAPAKPAARPPSETTRRAVPTAPAATPPVNLRRGSNVHESDRRFLEGAAPADRSIVRRPLPLDPDPAREASPSSAYTDIFAGTPYSSAPSVVQRQTIERAQAVLASRGFYRDRVDGEAGPATEEAILSYQRSAQLPMTGRLDLQTLAKLRLLPGRGAGNPALRPFNSPDQSPGQKVYRGIWVN